MCYELPGFLDGDCNIQTEIPTRGYSLLWYMILVKSTLRNTSTQVQRNIISIIFHRRAFARVTEDFRGTITQADLFRMREKIANITIGQD